MSEPTKAARASLPPDVQQVLADFDRELKEAQTNALEWMRHARDILNLEITYIENERDRAYLLSNHGEG